MLIVSTFTLLKNNDKRDDDTIEAFNTNTHTATEVKTHPHHFHPPNGKIIHSTVKGNPTKDVAKIPKETKAILKL